MTVRFGDGWVRGDLWYLSVGCGGGMGVSGGGGKMFLDFFILPS